MADEKYDYVPMWEALGMDVKAHDGLLAAVGQMYGDAFLTQRNRPASTAYLDGVASNLHSGRIRELVDGRGPGNPKKVIGTFCLYVPEEVITAAGAVEVGLCAGADWQPDQAERYVPRNTCPLIKGFMGFKLGRACPHIESADLVVGENTCDGKKKAYEQLSKLKPMYIMDVPRVRRYYKDLVSEEGTTVDQMLDDITDRYLNIQCAIFSPNKGRMEDVVRMAREQHADGIIDCSLQFCTIYDMESFGIQEAAREAGIPCMHVSTDYGSDDDGQLKTRIQVFVEMI